VAAVILSKLTFIALSSVAICCASAAQTIGSGRETVIIFDVEEEEIVGRLGVGLACFPPRPIRWSRDIRPDITDVRDPVATAFEQFRPDRIEGTVSKIVVEMCQPHWGPLASLVGRPTALKGKISITTGWRVRAQDRCGGLVQSSETQTIYEVTTQMRGGVSTALARALEKNAQETAKLLVSRPCLPSGS
jgi:hypothetical protein